jgi:DNA-binding ferritin-like protein
MEHQGWKKKVQEIGRALEEQGNEVLERISEEAIAVGKQAKASLNRARKRTEEILNSTQEIEEIKARLDALEEDQQRLSNLISELACQVGGVLGEIHKRPQAEEEEKNA